MPSWKLANLDEQDVAVWGSRLAKCSGRLDDDDDETRQRRHLEVLPREDHPSGRYFSYLFDDEEAPGQGNRVRWVR